MIGTVLGNRYELLEKIGTGGMAEVYKAKCRLLNRYVAVKILKKEYINDEEFLARFKTESQAAASLSHHNIVSIYDVGRDGDCNYIVMEYVEGITLKEYIDKNGIFAWRDAINISVQILDALEHAHNHNIVHRDIKPHNIMVTPDKSIKVMDFGIARAATASTLTLSGTTIGSVHYFSPEQAKGSYTDAKSDIYSMGIVMYEMLTGKVPFDGDSPISIAIMQIQNNPPSLKDYNISVPLALESIVMKAMNKDRDARYQTAAAMANDLKHLNENPSAPVKNQEPEKKDNMSGTRVIPAVRNTDIDKYLADNRQSGKSSGAVSHGSSKKPQKRKKGPDAATVIGIIAAVVLAVVALGLMSVLFKGAPEKKIPDLVGMTFEEACEKYEKGGITIIDDGTVPSDKYSEGIISEQSPEKGDTYKSKITIRVKMSSGKDTDGEGDKPKEEEITLDDYSGMSLEGVIEILDSLGLEYEEVSVEDEDVEPGKVVKTKPGKDAVVKKDQVIIIYVSTMENTVIVPNLMGKTLAEAKTAIKNAGLTVGTVTYMESEEEEGTVINQIASAGESVAKKAEIDLVVAKAIVKVEAPPVSKIVTVTVPQDVSSTRITVVANGKTVYDEVVDKNEIAKDVLVEGESPLKVEIYKDGVLVETTTYK